MAVLEVRIPEVKSVSSFLKPTPKPIPKPVSNPTQITVLPHTGASVKTNVSQIKYGGYLLIPAIGVQIPIVQSNNESALEKGVWLLPQTNTPDQLKNTALAAHRYKYRPPSKETFYLLDKAEKGDTIWVLWKGKQYKYLVSSISIVDPTHTEVLEDVGKPILTLITCYPLFSDKYRLVVQGELVI